MAKNVVDFFLLFPTRKKLRVCGTYTEETATETERGKRAYFQSEGTKCRLTSVDIWCLVSFEMNLSEWLKALMPCYPTVAVHLGLFLKSVYGCRFLSVFAEPLYKTIPENFSFLSLDNCTEWASSQFLFVEWLVFFSSLCSVLVCILFLFGRFMACLRAIYINTWYMKIKLCNKICRWSTVALWMLFSDAASVADAIAIPFRLFEAIVRVCVFVYRHVVHCFELLISTIFISLSFYLTATFWKCTRAISPLLVYTKLYLFRKHLWSAFKYISARLCLFRSHFHSIRTYTVLFGAFGGFLIQLRP